MSHRSVSLEPAGILALKDNSASADVRRLLRFELLEFMSERVLRPGRPATRQPRPDVAFTAGLLWLCYDLDLDLHFIHSMSS